MAKAKPKKKVDEALVAEWIEARDNLKRYKDQEAALRLMICELLVPNDNAGTFKFDIGKFPVKIAKKFNYSIEKQTYEELCDAFNETEKSCIRTTYEVAMKNYNAILKLADQGADVDIDNLQQCITVKPAMPTLSVGTNDEEE